MIRFSKRGLAPAFILPYYSYGIGSICASLQNRLAQLKQRTSGYHSIKKVGTTWIYAMREK